jgi:hypothetical protein
LKVHVENILWSTCIGDIGRLCEDYVHRIGLTGCAGAKGIAYTFFTAANARHAKELLPIVVEAGNPVNPEVSPMVSSSQGGGGGLSSILGQTGYCLRSVQSET